MSCPKLALFDLDHTLLPIDSDHAWGEFTADIGWVERESFKLQNDAFFEQYKAGTLDGADYVRFATQAFVERGPAQSFAAREMFMAQVIEPQIRPEALDLIDSHRKAGDQIIIVTATNEFVTRPIASRLGVAELIAVNLQRDDKHWFKREIAGVASMKEGKVTRVEQWLADRGWQWPDVPHATFYTDSMNDIALMERVHTAVATNPSPALRACAHERGWRVLDLFTKESH